MQNDLSVIEALLFMSGAFFILMLLYISIISLMENEKRAAIRSFLLIIPVLILYNLPPFIFPDELFAIVMLSLTAIALTVILFPTRPFEQRPLFYHPGGRINEKNVMFSRNLYKPGTDRYTEYYSEFPEHEAPDNKFREKPGLLSEDAVYYDPYYFGASKALFESIKSFYGSIDRSPDGDKQVFEPDKMAGFISDWVLKEGAVSVGFTETKDYHWYSLIGRGEDFGKPAPLSHEYAIAFTVEMDKEMMDAAPHAPTVLESARQYMHAAHIASSVALFLRDQGYEARAHIDGNYRVVCPLVARDAGLGEIGRMGLLMTPELGPRVRIGVVTTNFPFPRTEGKDHFDMIKFCRICKKCAHVCPSKAIPFNDRQEINGVRRWQIDQEACYTYWCIAGTDCGKCMSDCPYSHPDNPFHRLVRMMIRNSFIFRHVAVKMDDFFYGKNPASKYIRPKTEERRPNINNK